MDISQVLYRIENEEIEIIQDDISVQFDNRQQCPLGFSWRMKHFEVLDLYRVTKDESGNSNFLVTTTGGIYNLVLVRDSKEEVLSRSRWVLNYRVKEDDRPGLGEQSPVLLRGGSLMGTVDLMNAVYFHGHLCPELAVGYRVSLIAKQELGINKVNSCNYYAISENATSAADAVQYLTGCTVGKNNFFIEDKGKHVYYFARFSTGREVQQGLRIALINQVVGLPQDLEKKIIEKTASQVETNVYKLAMDQAVQQILTLPDTQLFKISKFSADRPLPGSAGGYVLCCKCGEVTLEDKTYQAKEGAACPSCNGRHSAL